MMNPELLVYMRSHPKWHILLSRQPSLITQLQATYKEETSVSFVTKLERVSMVLTLLDAML